jgi:UDP-N-acetylmuramoyl-L-alanyl-D-glutamate--2,6-diaminopimelate ligase
MARFKKFLKIIIPTSVLRPFLPLFHILQAYAANIKYGFPARGIKVIGVTGTNGKTTTAVMIAKILETAGFKVGLSSSALFQVAQKKWDNDLNMTVVDPFALQKLFRQMKQANVEWAVIEVTSHALSQYRVSGISIHTAVVTNLAPDHIDYHGSMQKYAAAKARLVKMAKLIVVLNRDDDWFNFFQKQAKTPKVLSFGASKEANARVTQAALGSRGSKFKIEYDGQASDVQIALPGKFNVYNALAAAAVGYGCGLESKQIAQGLQALSNIPGRFERIDEGQKFTVIVDYAHVPEAFKKFFESLKPLIKGKLIVVFGGMPFHDYVNLGKEAGKWANIAIITDDEPMNDNPDLIRARIVEAVHSSGSVEVIEIADRKEAIARAFAMAKPSDTVALLCLGSQQYRRVKNGRMPWDDRQVARQLLKKYIK